MENSEKPQAALELVVLSTLAHGPNHGFGIALHIERTSGALLRVEEGSLYPALHRLEKTGLVKAKWQVTDNARRARVYSLTPAGEKRREEIEKSWATLTQGVGKILGWT